MEETRIFTATEQDGTKRPSILLVEDDPATAGLYVDYLYGLLQYSVALVPTIDAAKQVLDKTDFDIVVCDYRLGDQYGTEFLKHVKGREKPLPFLLLSNGITEEQLRLLRSMGLDSFLPKAEVHINEIGKEIERLLSQT